VPIEVPRSEEVGRETADLWLASLALAMDANGAAPVFGRREAFDLT
jgi:hypothetical protein